MRRIGERGGGTKRSTLIGLVLDPGGAVTDSCPNGGQLEVDGKSFGSGDEIEVREFVGDRSDGEEGALDDD